MTFTFVTLFKELIEGYFSDSILKRAIDKDIIKLSYLNLKKSFYVCALASERVLACVSLYKKIAFKWDLNRTTHKKA